MPSGRPANLSPQSNDSELNSWLEELCVLLLLDHLVNNPGMWGKNLLLFFVFFFLPQVILDRALQCSLCNTQCTCTVENKCTEQTPDMPGQVKQSLSPRVPFSSHIILTWLWPQRDRLCLNAGGWLTIPAEALQSVPQELALPVVLPGFLHYFIQSLIFILSYGQEWRGSFDFM